MKKYNYKMATFKLENIQITICMYKTNYSKKFGRDLNNLMSLAHVPFCREKQLLNFMKKHNISWLSFINYNVPAELKNFSLGA